MEQIDSVVVAKFEELQRHISNLEHESEMSFWFGSDYPGMNFLSKGGASYLCYFPGQDRSCYISQNGQNVEGVVLINENEQAEVPLDTIISRSEALEAAREFFQSKHLPKCVKWLEL